MNRLSIAAAIAALLATASHAQTVGYSGEVVFAYGNERGYDRFRKQELRIGCGTVLSVRNVNQTPSYDAEYESQFGNNTSTTDIASLAVQHGLVGVLVGAVASLAVDATIAANKAPQASIKLLNIAKDQGLVKAVQVKLDSGEEINLPLLDANRWAFFGHYKVGNRYAVYYSATFDNVQLIESGEKASYSTPERAAWARKAWCGRTLSEEKTAEVLQAHANKVDESKVY